ncbi:MAG TPA: cation:proton antiporter [Polyangiaceae bacterium]|nr:cation:proton antiporter [Polyangiaceae bacterium]
MTVAALTPIPGHSVFLLLIQLALLLLVARLGAVVARALGLPAVVGELLAGIVLGPSVFGHYAPAAFALIFPQEALQFQLLEVVGLLGMVLLLLLTGLETDLRLLKNLGRAALVASAMGMVVPFAMGFGLGMWMPESYLAQPDQRGLFSAFLATAMAISAMPVIAKILMDLDLTKRNIGLVILSAGVVDDTAGWLILSVIAGAAAQGGAIQLGSLGLTLAYMTGFLLAMAFVVYPLLRFVLRVIATRARAPDNDLVVIVAVTMLCAAVSEKIGIHAVFGAFIAGTVLRQVAHLQHETVHRLESFVFSILAPVFFGIVGLKVDLWSLGGGYMLGMVLLIACLGKLIGCTIGGLWGGMSFWEALSIAVAMNARGAMELVVATIGLSLGILNQQMFSIIVMVAIGTSFMAPVGLRLIMRRVRMTHEEAQRILFEESRGVFDPSRLRILVPTAAGPNALEAARIALQISKRSDNRPEVLFIDLKSFPWFHSLRGLFTRNQAGRGLSTHLGAIQSLAAGGAAPRVRELASQNVARTIIEEATRGVDVIMIGASGRGPKVGGRVLEEVVVHAPCHVVIVKAARAPDVTYKRLIVPFDGSTVARVAAEFALRYAEATGAALTLAVISERQAPTRQIVEESADTLPGDLMPADIAQALIRAREINAQRSGAKPSADPSPDAGRATAPAEGEGAPAGLVSDPTELRQKEELARISPVFRVSEIEPRVLYLNYEQSQTALTREIGAGQYDLVVLGAENRAVKNRMFFGYENEEILEHSAVATLIVVPKIAMLK